METIAEHAQTLVYDILSLMLVFTKKTALMLYSVYFWKPKATHSLNTHK